MNERSANADPLATDLVERYLLGQLSEAETEAFEEYMLLHPEAAAAVEDAERLRRGLQMAIAAETAPAETQAQPALAPVVPLRRPASRRALTWAWPLAAAALLALAVASRLFGPSPGEGPAREIRLAQMRGGGEGPLLTLGDRAERLHFWLEMNTDLPGPFRVTLRRGEQILFEKAGVAREPGEPLEVEIESGLLEPGALEFRVETLDTPPRPAGRFQLVAEPAVPAPPGA